MKVSTLLALSLGTIPVFSFPSLLSRQLQQDPNGGGPLKGAYKQNDEICKVLAPVDPACNCENDDIAYCDIKDDANFFFRNGPDQPNVECLQPTTGFCSSGKCWLNADCGFDQESCACIGSTWTHKGYCSSRVHPAGHVRDLSDTSIGDFEGNVSLARREVVMAFPDPLLRALELLEPKNIEAATTMVATKLGPTRGKYLIGIAGRLTQKIIVDGVTWGVGQAWMLRHDWDPTKGYHVSLPYY